MAVDYFGLKNPNNEHADNTGKQTDGLYKQAVEVIEGDDSDELNKNGREAGIVKLLSPRGKPKVRINEGEDFHNDQIRDHKRDKTASDTGKNAKDEREFILTDEQHNDLWLIDYASVSSYFQSEENSKYAVFYLRKKCTDQKALLEVQEQSLGMKKAAGQQSKSSDINNSISAILSKFQDKHKNMRTYSLDYFKDPANDIKAFKVIPSIDCTNFIFNILILVIMVVQLFLYLDTTSAVLKLNWAANQRTSDVYTLPIVKADLLQTLRLTIAGSSLFSCSHSIHWLDFLSLRSSSTKR